jgi:hypothetical protein
VEGVVQQNRWKEVSRLKVLSVQTTTNFSEPNLKLNEIRQPWPPFPVNCGAVIVVRIEESNYELERPP